MIFHFFALPMRYIFICVLFLLHTITGKSQGTRLPATYSSPYPFYQLYQLDSIGNSNSISRYFGRLYFTFLQSIEQQLAPADAATKQLVRRFEKTFAQFYINACEAYCRRDSIEIREWGAYFSDTLLQPIQYKLLGTNAHLNGGLWQALTHSFSGEEMNQLRSEFVIFKRSLNQTYKLVYREAVQTNQKVNGLRKLSLGISEWIGNYYLYKWRKRQMKLAKFYWSASPRYSFLLEKIRRKKLKIDWLIIHTL